MKRAAPWVVGAAIVFAVVHFARDKGMVDGVSPEPAVQPTERPAPPSTKASEPSPAEPARGEEPAPSGAAAEDGAEDGEGEKANPFAVLLDRGQAFTDEAAAAPDMAGMNPDDEAYDPLTEARQIFHEFETDLLGHQPLNPAVFRQLLKKHKETNGNILRRAEVLRKAGHPEDAADMMGEWSRLYGHYQAQAYGRGPVPTE